ncbi:MAG: FHA domain-containing protein [Chloroflexia bacterium]|jgi:hypothetical protein|nr:FHA domain-containing protein [Chloroflexia bacterium]MDQ3614321.1 FHA domain-containing protein [Chloroflexota bacterium]
MPETESAFFAFEWVMLALRIAFIGLIYLFLYRIAQVALRELVVIGRIEAAQSQKSGRSAQAALIVRSPANASLDREARIPISSYTTVGRSPDNTLMIDDSFTSSAHAEVVRDTDGWSVRDLSSTNGTYVNDQQIFAPTAIESGDLVRFGNVVLEFRD